jgi:hypothetical protein
MEGSKKSFKEFEPRAKWIRHNGTMSTSVYKSEASSTSKVSCRFPRFSFRARSNSFLFIIPLFSETVVSCSAVSPHADQQAAVVFEVQHDGDVREDIHGDNNRDDIRGDIRDTGKNTDDQFDQTPPLSREQSGSLNNTNERSNERSSELPEPILAVAEATYEKYRLVKPSSSGGSSARHSTKRHKFNDALNWNNDGYDLTWLELDWGLDWVLSGIEFLFSGIEFVFSNISDYVSSSLRSIWNRVISISKTSIIGMADLSQDAAFVIYLTLALPLIVAVIFCGGWCKEWIIRDENYTRDHI